MHRAAAPAPLGSGVGQLDWQALPKRDAEEGTGRAGWGAVGTRLQTCLPFPLLLSPISGWQLSWIRC